MEKSSARVRVVTDSTSDLPSQLASDLGIVVVPLNVQFGEQVYQDGVNLSADDFYVKLKGSPTLPTTSQPSAGAFAQIYERLSSETQFILSLHISKKLSGTYHSAMLGKETTERDCHIEVIDSLQASMGLGLMAIAAARVAQAGAGLDELVGMLQQAIPRIHLFGVVDTLEYLHKGGRIGKAQALLGSLLKVKPIIGCQDGETCALGRVRTWHKALNRLSEMVMGFRDIEELAIMRSDNSEEADAYMGRLKSLLPQTRFFRAQFGPVIGTYMGPGSLGIALREGKFGVG